MKKLKSNEIEMKNKKIPSKIDKMNNVVKDIEYLTTDNEEINIKY